ncbi:MAG TPA: DUF2892 domain-containing protein [Actinomycetota bacterium]|nr:DUF2892 domain-containing protein [Actinomycetota bacterium]
MERFVRFMESGTGRLVRILLGVVLIVIDLVAVGGLAGTVIALIGLVPLIAGILGPCLVRPVLRQARAR